MHIITMFQQLNVQCAAATIQGKELMDLMDVIDIFKDKLPALPVHYLDCQSLFWPQGYISACLLSKHHIYSERWKGPFSETNCTLF